MWQKVKNIYHLINAILACLYYGFPSKKMKIIGVTGTNGKTTTTHMIAKILEEQGGKVGLSSTVIFKIGKKQRINKTKFTTTNSWNFQGFLADCLKAGCQHVVAETSSHALDQNRVWGTFYDLAVITNVTREHFDYHKNMQGYRKAKQKLFKLCAKNKGILVINTEIDNYQDFIFSEAKKVIGFNVNSKTRKDKKKSDQPQKLKTFDKLMKAKIVKISSKKSVFYLGKHKFELPAVGLFNIENAVASIAAAKGLGFGKKMIAKSLKSFIPVKGRMQEIKNDKGFRIIIDYALTPDSMEKIGGILKKQTPKSSRFYWIFGSCGNRDRGKRPIMGEIASKYADHIILTNEDPYDEDPDQIIKEIYKGTDKTKTKIIKNRKKAIEEALKFAKKGDIVLITGKGAEENMKIGSRLIDWNDEKAVKNILSHRKNH
ncbi:MAG: UDP-N-acetylmuramoyl-L-alanyl-D-glutamate--2,6-diaminopimelate ligase [Candidatus Moranbacteria bacterium]|nr:UDP-N-acetylmuramoyl-L-alanyl-D-glutamate--2,6-diaminopimelate ligase [Candidatus Moranbacteria bacterium]